MGQIDIVGLFSQVVFPIAVAAYLLWERTQTLEKMKVALVEQKIALYLILHHLELSEEYDKRIADTRKE